MTSRAASDRNTLYPPARGRLSQPGLDRTRFVRDRFRATAEKFHCPKIFVPGLIAGKKIYKAMLLYYSEHDANPTLS
jgi:hypothetical protein